MVNSNLKSKIMWTSGLSVAVGMAVWLDFIPAKIEGNLILFMTTAIPALVFYFRGWRTNKE